MSVTLLPRIESADASNLRQRLLENLDSGARFSEDEFHKRFDHSKAFPATGGRRVTEEELLQLRTTVGESLDKQQSESSESFDLAVGRVIYDFGSHAVPELGDPRVWDFIALVLLPDFAAWRLNISRGASGKTDSLSQRLKGGGRRHVFQRLWTRWQIFGPDIVQSKSLTEDDYAAIVERLISNRRQLSREVATAIAQSGYRQGERRTYTRIFMRRLQLLSGLIQIKDDDDSQLNMIIAEVHSQTVEAIEGV